MACKLANAARVSETEIAYRTLREARNSNKDDCGAGDDKDNGCSCRDSSSSRPRDTGDKTNRCLRKLNFVIHFRKSQ